MSDRNVTKVPTDGDVSVPRPLLIDLRNHLEGDRLIELGRAHRKEIIRMPIRQMCRKLEDLLTIEK